MTIFDLVNGIKKRFYRTLLKPFFGLIGKNSYIVSPLRIEGMANIFIGDNVNIMNFSWLGVQKHLGAKLIIGNKTYIGNFSHIDCAGKIEIGANVSIADKVYIGDNNYKIVFNGESIQLNGLLVKNISIGNNCWIGESVSILASSIGNNVIVNAGSVVTKDFPSNCIVAGNPAKIIRLLNR